MKVKVIPVGGSKTKFQISLTQGVQSFHLSIVGTKQETNWFAKMFRKALEEHDADKKSLTPS